MTRRPFPPGARRPKPFTASPIVLATLVLAAIASAALAPSAAFAQEASVAPDTTELTERKIRRGDEVAIASDVVIPADTVLQGNLTAIFGDVRIDGLVTGDVVVVLGTLEMSGTVKRDMVGVLTDMELASTTRVGGDFFNVLGARIDDGADIRGSHNNIALPGVSFFSLLRWYRATALFLFFVAILFFASMVPERLRIVSEEAPVRYFTAIFVGLLGIIAWLLVLPLLGATVIGFLLGYPLFVVLLWLGRAAILRWIGHRLGLALGLELSLLGSTFLAFVPYAFLKLAPLFFGRFFGLVIATVLSSMLFLFVDLPGLGLVLLTRAGNPKRPRRAAPEAPAPPPPAEPPPVVDVAPPPPPPPPSTPGAEPT